MYTPLSGRVLKGCWESAVSATPCSGTLSCGRGSRTQEPHGPRRASGRERLEPGLAESVGGEEGEVEAVQSAEEVGGKWMGALTSWQRHLGATMQAENPPSSENGGAALGRWTRGRGEAEEAAVEG